MKIFLTSDKNSRFCVAYICVLQYWWKWDHYPALHCGSDFEYFFYKYENLLSSQFVFGDFKIFVMHINIFTTILTSIGECHKQFNPI